MFINASAMYFLDTQMHMVTFLITMFEIVMLVFQVIYFLQRPTDKKRLQYLILLLCLIAYNVCSGLFTDSKIPIPIAIQTILAYLVGFTMSMYVIYYFYKVFDLKHLKFFATHGLLLFLFLPFVFLFVVPFLLTGDAHLSGKLTVIIPFLYGLGFIYSTTRALLIKFNTHRKDGSLIDDALYEHAVVAYIAMVCWAALPVIVFFGDFQVLEHSVTNAGFLMMTIIYVKSTIKQSRKEYLQLVQSERSLQELNKNLKRKVKRRTKKLERLMEDRKTTFINLAHETKTPLTLINNYLNEYIERKGNSEEMEIIKTNIGRLTNDIVNFFDVESYEKGFSIYNHDTVSNFSVLLSSKLVLFDSLAKRKNITINSNVISDVFIRSHPGAIDRIVNNIVENAIKYSEPGGLMHVQLEASQKMMTFSVKDRGPGIPDNLNKKVFEPYYKLSVNGKNFEGMGMGLSIVKRIVNDLNGNISIRSELGKGTEVQITLPLALGGGDSIEDYIVSDDVEFAHNQILLEESITDKEHPFILIVEDKIDMLNFLVKKLKEKYNVVIARTGEDAIRRIDNLTNLDLIISDVMMDNMDGYEFCRSVNSIEKYSHIPFLFLTACSTPEEKLKGLQLGAIDYIAKPFKIEELLIKVDSILSNLKRQRAAVVNRAYHSILSDNHGLLRTTVSAKRCAFADNCKKYRLTSREVEIIRLLIKGNPYKQMGDVLGISDKTVAKHVSNIFSKVGVGNKVELINKLEAQELLKVS
jgi:signal transduction histidine kinase/DNA-binding NarL/FixJ family response regulator